MADHIVKVLQTEFITHDVKRIVLEKPDHFKFIPGQATEVSILKPQWEHEKRPFTFTGLNSWDHLELIIKIYREHNGVTRQVELLKKNDELLIGDPWGTIQYKGPGVFIAAGAGITPFISILRSLKSNKEIDNCTLIYSNKTQEDIILKAELTEILEDRFFNILTREKVIGFRDRRIDERMLIELIKDFDQEFYICGPDSFVDNIKTILRNLGAEAESIIVES